VRHTDTPKQGADDNLTLHPGLRADVHDSRPLERASTLITMNQKELKELVEFLIEKDIAEFELERGDVKVRIKRGVGHLASVPPSISYVPVSAPAVSTSASVSQTTPGAVAPAKSTSAAPASDEGLHLVRSPIVGTYYESPSPGSPPFVKVGDKVEIGQVLCIVEAMKLMNEIEADATGEIAKILVSNNQPIEYGQALFAIRT
jgi:acetyl-CoA carboxylase biotin carboxyl carrier protein